MPAVHGSHTKSIDIEAPPSRVFQCFSTLELRHKWFRVPGSAEHTLDFRVGGFERTSGDFTALDHAERIETVTQFIDIVPNERIVYSYALTVDRLRSASLVTITLTGSTHLEYHEQYTSFDPESENDVRHIEGGTRLLLNGLKVVAEG